MLQLLILSAIVAALCCPVLIRWGRSIAARYSMDMPQRFHAGDVPRLGGVAMLVALSVGIVWAFVAEPVFGIPLGVGLRAAEGASWLLPIFVAGLTGTAEDVRHGISARWRLLGTLVAGGIATFLLDLRVSSLGLPFLDAVWQQWSWLAWVLPVLAIAGLPHAFNLIDGYNGLAGTVAIICCCAIAYVALQVGDRQLAALVLALTGAAAGFLLWNYPRGMIFAGDGGAYLWGVVIAMAAVMLVDRHTQVSPWFPMLLLSYPVVEVGFSAYRKVVRGQSPGVPDALHIHQLIYRRIVREVFHDDESRRILMRNNRTSPYLWGFALFTVVPAILFWRNTTVLMICCVGFCTLYVWVYTSIVRFRVPRWLRQGRQPK